MSLIDCEINLILTWSKNCVVSSATAETKFAITNTKRYVITVTLSTKDNEKLLEKLKEQLSGINISQKCQWKDQMNIEIT